MTDHKEYSENEKELIDEFRTNLTTFIHRLNKIKNLFLDTENEKSEMEAMYLMGVLASKFESLEEYYVNEFDGDEDEE